MSFTPILLSSSGTYGSNTNDTPKVMGRGEGNHFCLLPSSLATVVLIMTTTDMSIVIIPAGGSPQAPVALKPNNGNANINGAGSIYADPTLDIIYVSAVDTMGDDVSWVDKYSINVGANTFTKINTYGANTPLGSGWMSTAATDVLINNTLSVGVTTWASAASGTASATFSQNVYCYNPTATTTSNFGVNATPTKNVVSSDTNITANANAIASVLKIGSTPYALFGMCGTGLLKLHRLTVTATTASTTILGTYTMVSPLGINNHNEDLANFTTDGTDIYIAYSSSTTAITIAKWSVGGATSSTIATISSLSKVTDIQIEYYNGNLWLAWADGVTQANLEAVYATYSTSGVQITARTVVAGGDALGYQGSMIGIVGSNLLYGYQKGTASPSSAYYGVLASTGTAYTKSLNDSVASSETFSKIFVSSKSLADAIATSESLIKSAIANKSDSLSTSDAIVKKLSAFKTLADSAAATDSLIKLTSKSQFDAMTLAETIKQATSKSQFDSISLADLINKKTTSKSQFDVIAMAETIGKLIAKSQFDSISTSDTIISKRLTVTVADMITTSESTGKGYPKLLNDIVSTSDSITHGLGKALNLNDSIAIIDAISKSLKLVSTDFISVSETRRNNVSKSISDSLTLSEILTKNNFKNINDLMMTSDSISKNSVKAMSDSILLFDNITKSFTIFKIDSINASESKNISNVKRLSELLTLSDITVNTISKSIILSDNIPISDVLTKSTSKILLDTLAISDMLSKNLNIRMYDIVITTDSRSLLPYYAPKLIGTIQLKGEKALYIYLVGDQNGTVYLRGGLQ